MSDGQSANCEGRRSGSLIYGRVFTAVLVSLVMGSGNFEGPSVGPESLLSSLSLRK